MTDNRSFTKLLGLEVVMYMQTQKEAGINEMITELLKHYTIEEIISMRGFGKFIPNIYLKSCS